jgi:hypothetical protein
MSIPAFHYAFMQIEGIGLTRLFSWRPSTVPQKTEIQTRHTRAERDPEVSEKHRFAAPETTILEIGEWTSSTLL